jgi:predicted transglutaminase-like cysteine proteinase
MYLSLFEEKTGSQYMSRAKRTLLALAALAAVAGGSAQAGVVSQSAMLHFQSERISFATPALAPVAFTRFCVQYPKDCERGQTTNQRPQPEAMTQAPMRDLEEVNRDVNRAITYKADLGGVLSERWLVSQNAGACHDYAVTKRHGLLARSWPLQSLLLAEVVVPSGEHHLVLVVRTSEEDLVLDSINHDIRPWSRTSYQWIRIQSLDDPNRWSSVAHDAA